MTTKVTESKKKNSGKGSSGSGKSSGKSGKGSNKLIVTIVCLLVMGWGVWQFTSMASRYDGDDAVWVRIPHDATKESVRDSLHKALGPEYGEKIYSYWGENVEKSRGAYLITPGDKAITIARNLDNGRQTPIKLTFNNIRTLDQLAERLTSRMDWEPGEFEKVFNERAAQLGVTPEVLLGRMMPDTYEVYWSSGVQTVLDKILKNYDSFWTEERREKAANLGLTPEQVVILASIAEEESNKADERGKIARLYINRLNRGMKLQADPTVKYALGDFSIKRVGGEMLEVNSPYNTYRYAGLPPGPIRIPDRRTLDAVLDAPKHDYIYMCAKADFSGYHEFTSDYATHQRNAAAFRRAMDQRGITLK